MRGISRPRRQRLQVGLTDAFDGTNDGHRTDKRALAATGLPFARWGQDVIRFVTHFDSTEAEADEVIAIVRHAMAGS